MNNIHMNYPADIWGPPFWHFLHMIAMIYPDKPNRTMKKNIMIS